MRTAFALSLMVLLLFTAEFWLFVVSAVAQLMFGSGVEGFPSPSVF